MHPEELWTAPTFKARMLRTVLTPASWLYALGWQSYLAIYRLGFKRSKEPHSPVVCIGNLIAGGAGKTPTTIHIADVLLGIGRPVVISCSGYGSPSSEAARLAPEGPLKASIWGDEAALVRWLRPDVPLIVGRRRVLSAEVCHREFPNSVLLMDDGFQHLPLRKHLTILLDPPQWNRRCLPAGPYREPSSNHKRADLLISDFGPNQADEQGPRRRTEFRVQPHKMGFSKPDGTSVTLTDEVAVLCALARPHGFVAALKTQGLTLEAVSVRPDHDPLADGNLLSGLPPGLPIVVTGKDWVKLRERSDVGRYDIAIASHEVSIAPPDEFTSWLKAKLDGLPNKEDQ